MSDTPQTTTPQTLPDLRMVHISQITADSAVRGGERHGSFERLSKDVAAHGVLTPLRVFEKEGRLVLLSGARRLRAARAAGTQEVPVVVEAAPNVDGYVASGHEASMSQGLREVDQVMLALQLTAMNSGENAEDVVKAWKRLAKDDLKPAEDPQGDPGMRATLNRTLQGLGIWPTDGFLQLATRVLRLPPELLTLYQVGEIDFEQAQALARVKDPQTRSELVSRASKGEVTAMQILRLVKQRREMEKGESGGAGGDGDGDAQGASSDSDEGDTAIEDIESALEKRIQRLPETRRADARKHLRGLLGVLSTKR